MLIHDWYYCDKCGIISWENVNFCSLDHFYNADVDAFCAKCSAEVLSVQECPIHGVAAIGEGGDCMKC